MTLHGPSQERRCSAKGSGLFTIISGKICDDNCVVDFGICGRFFLLTGCSVIDACKVFRCCASLWC